MSSGKASEHLTSKIIFAPGFLFKTCLAINISTLSIETKRPLSSTMPSLSPSPSKPIPISALIFFTFLPQSSMNSGTEGLGFPWGKEVFKSQYKG